MNRTRFAWITSTKSLKIIMERTSIVEQRNIKLNNHLGDQIKIKQIKQNSNVIEIELSEEDELNFLKNHIITIENIKKYAYFTREILDQHFFSNEKPGAGYSNGILKLKVWSPPATSISVEFFDKENNQNQIRKIPLTRGQNGIWHLEISANNLHQNNLHGTPYRFEIKALGKTSHAIDPYAKSITAFTRKNADSVKGIILEDEKCSLDGFEKTKLYNKDIISSPLEFIGYEMHVRDFTIDPELKIDEKLKGTYLGVKKQIHHLKKLGITHAQLLPIQSCYTVDETNREFQDETVSTNMINYNWGYDAHHYFTPSGWFSTDPDDPLKRILELKEMISEFHKNKIGVIMDVVYNHLYRGAVLENLAPGCYLRRNDNGDISTGTGAGDSLESRTKMVRQLIVDSLEYFCHEFHINGFRFDLMGFIDHETMKEIRKRLGDDIILYGEGWDFTDIPGEEATTKCHLPANTNIAVFNDTTRNSYTGELEKPGFIQGNNNEAPKVRTGIIAGLKGYPTDYDGDDHLDVFIDEYIYHCFANSPKDTINYLSIHDGYTLWDKINLSYKPSEQYFKKNLCKLALAMLFTSQGKIVLEGGTELGRSKPLAKNDPNKNRAHTTKNVNPENGITHFHENSYRSPDITNMFNWKRGEEFNDLFNYIQGLILLRKTFPCLRYQESSSIKKGLRFIAEHIPNAEKYATAPNSRHTNWNKVEFMNLEFINGPPNTKLYIIGEVHPKFSSSKNPRKNPFVINFDKEGHGKYKFVKEQIQLFDLNGWSDPNNLQIKLVSTPGNWDGPDGFYSKVGNNTVKPNSINKKTGRATIDLAIINHTAGNQELRHNGHISYFVDNTIEPPSKIKYQQYDKLLIIHNANAGHIEIESHELLDFSQCDIMVDGRNTGIRPIKNSSVKIIKDNVKIPGKTSTVIGCIKKNQGPV